jgi:hypothetical protein
MKTGRKPDPRVAGYMRRYGVSERTVRIVGVEQLERMAPHARATMFSSLKWDREHRGFRTRGSVTAKVPGLYRQRLALERRELELRREQRKREKQQLEQQPPDRRHLLWMQSLLQKRRDVARENPVEGECAPDPRGEQLMELASKLRRIA